MSFINKFTWSVLVAATLATPAFAGGDGYESAYDQPVEYSPRQKDEIEQAKRDAKRALDMVNQLARSNDLGKTDEAMSDLRKQLLSLTVRVDELEKLDRALPDGSPVRTIVVSDKKELSELLAQLMAKETELEARVTDLENRFDLMDTSQQMVVSFGSSTNISAGDENANLDLLDAGFDLAAAYQHRHNSYFDVAKVTVGLRPESQGFDVGSFLSREFIVSKALQVGPSVGFEMAGHGVSLSRTQIKGASYTGLVGASGTYWFPGITDSSNVDVGLGFGAHAGYGRYDGYTGSEKRVSGKSGMSLDIRF